MTLTMIAALILIAWYAGTFGNCYARNGRYYSIGLYRFVISTILGVICLYFTGFFDVWAWPQIAWYILTGIGVGVFYSTPDLVLEGKHNVLSSVIAYSIIWFLYYQGGVLNCFFNQ